MKSLPGVTIWEKLGASSGIWAVLWLGIGYLISQTTSADLNAPPTAYARQLLLERMQWEWVTLMRILGAMLLLWFMGSLAGRLRLAEGEPGRLAGVAFGIGVAWAGVWLLSGFFNSASLLLADKYGDPAGSHIAGVLAREIPLTLTAGIMCGLLLAIAYVGVRFGGFPKAYSYSTVVVTLAIFVLGLINWGQPRDLGPVILWLAFGWTVVTSAVIILPYHPPDIVRGAP